MHSTGPGDISPLDVLLTLMREKWHGDDRDAAAGLARLAAPYVHGRAPPEAAKRSLTNLTDEELAGWVDRLDPVEDDLGT